MSSTPTLRTLRKRILSRLALAIAAAARRLHDATTDEEEISNSELRAALALVQLAPKILSELPSDPDDDDDADCDDDSDCDEDDDADEDNDCEDDVDDDAEDCDEDGDDDDNSGDDENEDDQAPAGDPVPPVSSPAQAKTTPNPETPTPKSDTPAPQSDISELKSQIPNPNSQIPAALSTQDSALGTSAVPAPPRSKKLPHFNCPVCGLPHGTDPCPGYWDIHAAAALDAKARAAANGAY